MSRIPQTFIDDLLDRTDIVQIIDSRVKLKRTGKNYAACCPFHEEKTPSFTVSPDKQFYYCFGCGASGTALGFILEYERIGFVDAVESLARLAGLEVPREDELPPAVRAKQQAAQSRQKKLYLTLEQANEIYQKFLREHPNKGTAVRYLQNRGLSGIIGKAYGLGYAPPGWDNLLNKLNTQEESVDLLVDAGLVISKEEDNKVYDRFRHRITFPIHDIKGRVIGFGGRVLGDDKPKYLNSPETEVFRKGKELYGLYEARQNCKKLDQLVVVEGYMDVIALAQYGIYNAVATLGTACGEDHLKLGFRFVSEIVFCFDGDKAGRTAAKRALLNSLSAMEDGRQIKFLFLPEGQDPDSLVRQIGADRFQALLKKGVGLEEFLFEVAAEGCDLSSLDGRAKFSRIAAPLVEQLPTGVFKSLMFDMLAKRTGLDSEALKELTQDEQVLHEVASQIQHNEQSSQAPSPQQSATANTPSPPVTPTRKNTSKIKLSSAKTATILLLSQPSLLKELNEEQDLLGFEASDEDLQTLSELIAYLRKRPEANFNNILGYWSGTKGLENQKQLTQLVASEFMTEARNIGGYDCKHELLRTLTKIQNTQRREKRQAELQTLTAKGLTQLSADEKARYITLIRPE